MYVSVTKAPGRNGSGPAYCIPTTSRTSFVCRGNFGSGGARSGSQHRLDEFDLCSVPGGIYRTFENVGTEPGLLLLIVHIQTEKQEDDVVLSATEARGMPPTNSAPIRSRRGVWHANSVNCASGSSQASNALGTPTPNYDVRWK